MKVGGYGVEITGAVSCTPRQYTTTFEDSDGASITIDNDLLFSLLFLLENDKARFGYPSLSAWEQDLIERKDRLAKAAKEQG